ncbi:MAG: hypothetical protein EPO32_05540 [Anaerolineae bacterium]|nr:MAG: hypothetical protein EPO32_05540 [Anaerolineae bacterium]
MKIILNRNTCTHHQAECEKCFGNKLMLNAFEDANCVQEIRDPHITDIITIYMTDRDGSQKTLILDKASFPDAYDSWMLFYEKQQADLAAG